MSRFYIAKGSSAVNAPFGVGVSKEEAKNRNMIIHGYSVASRAADFAADVQIDLIPGYSALGAELVDTLNITNPTASYESDFTATADGWVDNTASGVTYTANSTIGGKDDCLKITADAGGDVLSIKKPTQCTIGNYYKCTFDFYKGAAEAGIVFLGLGVEADNWNLTADHISGKNPAPAAAENWKSMTVYGKATATDLEIAAFTNATGSTEDEITASKDVYFKDIVLYDITTQVDGWVASAEGDWGWSGVDSGLSCDAGAGGTATYTITGADAGDLYKASYTIDDYTAATITATIAGTAWVTPSADGTYTIIAESDGTDTIILTADGTAEMTVEDISVKKLGINTDNSIYHHTIRSAVVEAQIVPFPAPLPMGNSGWMMYFTPGGAANILDINVFYQIV